MTDMCVSGPEPHLYMCAAPLLILHLCLLVFRQHWKYRDIPRYSKYYPSPLTHMLYAHTNSPQSTLPLQGHLLTSAERRKACHRRSKTLTISEFTSAQAQGSTRSDRPPNSLVIKDKDTEEGEGERKKD